MKRRAFNVLAAVSLVMAIAVAGLWARSVWWKSDVLVIRIGTLPLRLSSSEGRIWGDFVGPGFDISIYHSDSGPAPTRWFPHMEANRNRRNVYFADWLLILVFAVMPVAWLVMRLRRRNAVGLCAKCGYDLRGSPGPACPECGAPIPAKAN